MMTYWSDGNDQLNYEHVRELLRLVVPAWFSLLPTVLCGQNSQNVAMKEFQ